MTLAWHPPGGNPLPPCPAQPHLRRAIDGKDRCVSRQARGAGRKAPPARAFLGFRRLAGPPPQFGRWVGGGDGWGLYGFIDNGRPRVPPGPGIAASAGLAPWLALRQ